MGYFSRLLVPLGVLLLVGCTDLSAYRFAGLRKQAVVRTEGVPKPAAALSIPDPPRAAVAEEPTVPVSLIPEPGPETSVVPSENPLRRLADRAAQKYAGIDSYIVRLRRREVVNGKSGPEELLVFKCRKEPFSVYFKWVGPEGKGREVVYVAGRHEDKIHTLTAAGDVPLLPGGSRFAIAHDSRLVRAKSRHPITDAGFGRLVARFGALVTAAERGDTTTGTLKYLGPVTRPEFPHPVEAVEQTVARGGESLLPGGGSRVWHFDPASGLPALIVTKSETGREVEYYSYDRFEAPVRLDDDDFNPDKLWKREP